jgi:hypothetical protein
VSRTCDGLIRGAPCAAVTAVHDIGALDVAYYRICALRPSGHDEFYGRHEDLLSQEF